MDSYLLLVRLPKTENPVISRLLSVPADMTFDKLHRVIQTSFGWVDNHPWFFNVVQSNKHNKNADPFFPWNNEVLLSLHPLTDPDEGVVDDGHPRALARHTRLADVFDDPRYNRGKAEVIYEYDTGDSWNHQIVFMGRTDPGANKLLGVREEQRVWCVAGEGHPCAEDCGGGSGWEELKKLFADSSRPDPEDLKGWYVNACCNGDHDGLDPWKWDIKDVNEHLALLSGSWWGGSIAIAL